MYQVELRVEREQRYPGVGRHLAQIQQELLTGHGQILTVRIERVEKEKTGRSRRLLADVIRVRVRRQVQGTRRMSAGDVRAMFFEPDDPLRLAILA